MGWADVLQHGAVLAGCAFALREALIVAVVVWSMRTDDKGREHALKLLKVLRVQIRRPPADVLPPSPPLPPGP